MDVLIVPGTTGGSIEIIQRGITDIPADCIVNAANERLLEGGGVCGYIFKPAGSDKLTEACQKIGYCDCGSAAITPAFDLPAKYIIHAVGPRYTDGKHGEPEKLYSCYQKSLELVKENKCHSIVFPLISAGIFGYPEKDAARKAFEACRDFMQENADYRIDIMFAIPSGRINSMAKQVLQEVKIDVSEKDTAFLENTAVETNKSNITRTVYDDAESIAWRKMGSCG